ncbi:hypothetical protein H4R34_001667 [Dimargaris verticillata]|uniref:Uncharacterized protein n=1 Tax=Dimargaris verticillata TaxID=2761393 RepID=A0A9W8B3Z7_9FUNG|nr:hypothetical protein H4R34_001667 [Dimargaris verticillata]
MYRVDHKFKLPPNPDGSADWSNHYIYPNGWQSPSTSRIVVKEPDPAWNMHRLNQLYGGSNLLTNVPRFQIDDILCFSIPVPASTLGCAAPFLCSTLAYSALSS